MSDIGDYSDYGDSDVEWMYMEDHYDEADVLAEHACPSPTWGQVMNSQEYDPYDYWEDLAYLSDGYYDRQSRPLADERKRKNTTEHQNRQRKRRRKSATEDGGDKVNRPVVWRLHRERERDDDTLATAGAKTTKPVALLKDWQERFKHATGLTVLAGPGPSSTDLASEDPLRGAFNVESLQSIVNMLSDDSIGTLQEIMEAKGLDPDAVEAVLADLMAGDEPGGDQEATIGDRSESRADGDLLADEPGNGPERKRSALGQDDSEDSSCQPRAKRQKKAATDPARIRSPVDEEHDTKRLRNRRV